MQLLSLSEARGKYTAGAWKMQEDSRSHSRPQWRILTAMPSNGKPTQQKKKALHDRYKYVSADVDLDAGAARITKYLQPVLVVVKMHGRSITVN